VRLYRNLACLTALLFSIFCNFSEARPHFRLDEGKKKSSDNFSSQQVQKEFFSKAERNSTQLFSPNDTCPIIHFSRSLTPANANYRLAINDFIETSDGGFMMVGRKTNSDGNIDGLFMRVDREGSVVWQRSFDLTRNDQPYRIRIDHESNYIVAGFLQNGFLVTRIDTLGNVLWSKQYADDQLSFFDMIVSSDHGIVICGYRFSAGLQAAYLTKLDVAGNVSWSRTYDHTGQDYLSNLIETSDGYVVSAVSAMAGTDGVMMKVNKSNGDPVWVRKYDFDGRADVFQQVYNSSSNTLVNVISRGDATPLGNRQIIGKVDNSGNMSAASLLNTSHDISYADFRLTNDAGLIAIQTRGQGPEPFAYLYKLDANDNLQWGRKQAINVTRGIPLLAPAAGGDYAISAGLKTSQDGSSRLLKTNAEGRVPGCPDSVSAVRIEPSVVTQSAYTWADIGSGNLNAQSITLSLVSETIQSTRSCFPTCESIQATGSDSVCFSQDTIWYKVVKDATCNLPVSWSIDTSRASVLVSTDSTVAIHIKQPGNIQLIATAALPCKIITDTLRIYASDIGGNVNLGPDITVCSGNSNIHVLKAGSTFASYLWQDGSTDSVMNVSAAGTYFVTVTDFCGGTYSDTVIVTLSSETGVELGLDIIKCIADTITITAPDGFVRYSWTPAYKTGLTDSRELRVFTDIETVYELTAERASGCISTDVLRVSIYNQKTIDLGPDTTICINNIIPLNAGAGFITYEWNTGESTQTINADSAGVYLVKAIDQNGCISRDTITIQQLAGLSVSLGPDTTLCDGEIVLDAGDGFGSYLWSNGSTERKITVDQPGIYYVTVTGHAICGASDTIEVRQPITTPLNFLQDTAIFCRGRSIELRPNNEFSAYSWNTGATSSSITVTSPGVYHLQVIDAAGCSGHDTIRVSERNCAIALVFPNAFTPNNDFKNDLFLPQAPSSIQKYYLAVYNRWGQKVFESNDPRRGWDGGNHSSQSFIYYCTYKLEGDTEKENVVRGTVTLIR
jgi:gliding motility-associated-like protein